jgi:hypothetical protein
MSRCTTAGLLLILSALVGCESLSPLPPAEPAASGCWVKIYARENYDEKGRWDVINGPGQWPLLYDLPGSRYPRWDDKIESIIVGPKTRVTLWADDNFGQNQVEFGPDKQIPKLRVYDFQHDAESMKLELVP